MNNKPIQTFEDLNVYQRAYRISLEIHKETFFYPRQEQMRGIADQIRRASKGICANNGNRQYLLSDFYTLPSRSVEERSVSL